jgi:hypothetical protein
MKFYRLRFLQKSKQIFFFRVYTAPQLWLWQIVCFEKFKITTTKNQRLDTHKFWFSEQKWIIKNAFALSVDM